MKIKSSLKSLKKRDLNSKLVRRRGRVYIFIYYLLLINILYKSLPGDYCESVIPDPIPNSEVKPFCADGTLS